ncbi:MFS transporter [Candidatus Bipolaricaulota bacterium]|nr:MFS transporter [Candidatus Bipolaricaulota bacterium]
MRENTSGWKIRFFTIWTGQQLSLIGSRAAQFALVWWLTTTTGSATVLATATMVALFPQILLGPLAGAYIDRWNRRRVMMIADSFIALISLWLAYLFFTDMMQIWHVYIVILARSLGGGVHWPAMAASTTLLVPGKHLTRVAGINQMMNGALAIIGPPLGALLLVLLPLHGVMLVDAGTALFAVAPLLFLAIPQPTATNGATKKRSSVWSDLLEGLRYLRGWPGALALIGGTMLIAGIISPAFALMPLLVYEHFGGDAAALALLQAAIGVGLLLGGLILSAWGGFKRKVYTISLGLIGVGIGVLAVGLVPVHLFVFAIAAMFVVGLMNPFFDGPIMAVFQSTVPPGMQGRVFALLGSLVSVTAPLGLAIAGPVSDRFGIQIWYVIGGILCLLVAVSFLFFPAILHIEEDHPGSEGIETTVVVESATD